MTSELSWEPKRNGVTYCAPACGGGCTRRAFNKATAAAKAAAERLDRLCPKQGPWKPHVWENLGWHWSVISASGKINVRPPKYGRTTWCADAIIGRQFLVDAMRPETSVRGLIKAADEWSREQVAIVTREKGEA